MNPKINEKTIWLCVFAGMAGAVVAVLGINWLCSYGRETTLLFPLIISAGLMLETVLLLLKGSYV